jgi:aminopeptidase YwaD
VKLRYSGLAAGAVLICGWATPSAAQPPFLSEPQWVSLREEAGGAAPYENLRRLTQLHRVPATPAFDEAAEFVLERAQQYGLQDVHAERFPIDGKIQYGLMRSHIGWTVESARLWQISPNHTLLGDWATDPIRLADYSHSADIQTSLVDVGAGTREADYDGQDVHGKIVLADGVLSSVQRLAIMKFGAAGIISDMPNQATAWSGLDSSIVRWGHLDGTLPQGFAFMISAGSARDLRAQLNNGTPVTLEAHVRAEVGAGHWTVVTGVIPGSNPTAGEVVYSCHLDHQRPGANDNGSGCVSILESARVLARLIAAGQLPQPARTLRFIWGPEVEGTMAYLSAHPDIRSKMRADIHMDMVGGDLFKNKSVLHVTQTPWSLPTFITDIGASFAETIRDAAARYAADGSHAAEAVLENRNGAPGSRNAFFVDETPYSEGSDHDDYDSSTIAVPSLYLCDWPDIYIHTDRDSIEQIDATKLRRVALLGAASGYTYAALDAARAPRLIPFLAARSQQRIAKGFERAQVLADGEDGRHEAHNLIAKLLQRELGALRSFATYTQANLQLLDPAIGVLKAQAASADRWIDGMTKPGASRAESTAQGRRIPRRIADFGPLTFQNDDVLLDRLGRERMRGIKLLDAESSRLLNVQDKGSLYAYEIVNFIDGKRSVTQIRDEVAAELGPIPLELVLDYLKACEDAKVIEFR